MATVTLNAKETGKASSSPLWAFGDRNLTLLTGTFAFDSSYPTGGESITDIYDMFRSCNGVIFQGSDGTRLFAVDHTNKKVKAFSALGTEVANATDLSAVTGIRWLAWGIR